MVAIISQGIFVPAIVWTLWQLVRVRRKLCRGDIVIPPLIAGTLVFALGIIAVIVAGLSPLHLVWWFPFSFMVGLVVLLFPMGTRLLLNQPVTSAGELRAARQREDAGRMAPGKE